MKAKLNFTENVTYELRGSDGQIKKLFQENRFAAFLLKTGRLSPHWMNAWYAPIVWPFFGHFADKKVFANLVVNVGMAAVAGMVNGSVSFPVFQYLAVGIGTATAAATDTALGSEILDSGLARGTATVSRQTTDTTNDTARALLSFSVTGTKAVTEAGIFNHIGTAVGTMLARQVFSAINVVSGDTLQITYDIDCDNA